MTKKEERISEAHDRDDRLATLNRTIDWLEANPDRAVRGHLARDEDGYACDPKSDQAECFCFIGRLIVEADIPRDGPNVFGDYGPGVEQWFEGLPLRYDRFMGLNDSYAKTEERIMGLRGLMEKMA